MAHYTKNIRCKNTKLIGASNQLTFINGTATVNVTFSQPASDVTITTPDGANSTYMVLSGTHTNISQSKTLTSSPIISGVTNNGFTMAIPALVTNDNAMIIAGDQTYNNKLIGTPVYFRNITTSTSRIEIDLAGATANKTFTLRCTSTGTTKTISIPNIVSDSAGYITTPQTWSNKTLTTPIVSSPFLIGGNNANIPTLTGTSTLVALGLAQTFPAAITFSVGPAFTSITINGFNLAVPTATGADTFATLSAAQSFTARKTYTVAPEFTTGTITTNGNTLNFPSSTSTLLSNATDQTVSALKTYSAEPIYSGRTTGVIYVTGNATTQSVSTSEVESTVFSSTDATTNNNVDVTTPQRIKITDTKTRYYLVRCVVSFSSNIAQNQFFSITKNGTVQTLLVSKVTRTAPPNKTAIVGIIQLAFDDYISLSLRSGASTANVGITYGRLSLVAIT